MREMRFKVRLVKWMSIFQSFQPTGPSVGYRTIYNLGVDNQPWIYLIHSRCYFCASAFIPASLWLALGYCSHSHLLPPRLLAVPFCRTGFCQLPSTEEVLRRFMLKPISKILESITFINKRAGFGFSPPPPFKLRYNDVHCISFKCTI